ncbi:MAG: peptide chain release factor 2 [bacterium]|nr:peptide chain release factor 2 [bacterium]
MIYGGYFDTDNKIKKLEELNIKISDETIWNDRNLANSLVKEQSDLKKSLDKIITIKEKTTSNINLLNMLEQDFDDEIFNLLLEEQEKIKKDIEELELETLLNGKYDKLNCIFEIHSGAGGTEACDFANMIFRMYLRYFDKKGYKYSIIDMQEGEEVGIKSVSIEVDGFNAYGYLKCEMGVHRLIRLSPFDANHKRHTSFAAVFVNPLTLDTEDIKIEDKDLKIDVYRSSGAGGQSVNTTDSAVRITHLPTGIVVTCQNERSQLQNKEKALSILKSKLKLIEEEKERTELDNLKKDNKNIEFGSQIRSYVMHPYSMVKDHRTNISTSAVDKVLDGDLDIFIEGYLRK